MGFYTTEIEEKMIRYYESLSEKDRRRYAAIEAVKLGHGGISYISRVLGCNYRTIVNGMGELEDEQAMNQERIRASGAGRQSAWEKFTQLDEKFLQVIEKDTAGSPMDEKIKWTHLTRQQIAEGMKKEGIKVSVTVVDKLLEKHKFRRRKALKKVRTGDNPQRNSQFEKIEKLKLEYVKAGNPVVSIDTKKKS